MDIDDLMYELEREGDYISKEFFRGFIKDYYRNAEYIKTLNSKIKELEEFVKKENGVQWAMINEVAR